MPFGYKRSQHTNNYVHSNLIILNSIFSCTVNRVLHCSLHICLLLFYNIQELLKSIPNVQLLKQLIFSFSPPLKGRDFNCSYLARTIINNVPVICNISIGYVSNNLAALFSKVHFILISSVYCTNCFRYFHYMKSTMCQR